MVVSSSKTALLVVRGHVLCLPCGTLDLLGIHNGQMLPVQTDAKDPSVHHVILLPVDNFSKFAYVAFSFSLGLFQKLSWGGAGTFLSCGGRVFC